ncbi:MAG TPA: tripartite tricarboxylate transporter substrate binding protein, partial [Burkholderiales bacterium]|nr:tripartite tricarboxylate transporter substrate binding protein [Burkholderiales bacterium]
MHYRIILLTTAVLLAAHPVHAQDNSKRPVRLLVPSPPGGPSDFAGRLIAPGLAEGLSRNVVVDARQSVNGILSME